MRHYIARPSSPRARIYYDDGYYYDGGSRISCDVHEPKDEPVPTGLLDKDGNELMRKPVRRPIGFRHVYGEDD